MAGSSRRGVVRTLRRNVDLRIRTLEELVAGRRNPLDRRTAILQRRTNLISAVGGRRSTTAAVTENSDESDEDTDTEDSVKSEENEPGVDTDDKVEIEVASPTEEELRAANELAEKHEDADAVTVVEENRVRVESDSGTTFTVRVAEVLGRNVESSEPDTAPSAIPSMSEAVANKRGI